MIDLHLYIYIYMCEYNIDYELIENQYCLTDYNKLFSRSNLLVIRYLSDKMIDLYYFSHAESELHRLIVY